VDEYLDGGFDMTLTADLAHEITAALRSLPVLKVADPIDISDFEPDFEQFRPEIEAELKAAFLTAFQASGADVGPGRANELATQYALARAGDLISGKYALGDATMNYLKEVVAQAVENGRSIGDIVHALRYPDPDTGETLAVFSAARAQMIAVTETATALGVGNQAAAREMDQDQKSWESSGDETTCEDCDGNDGDGWIGIDDTFSSGDDDIPQHPGCRCVVVYQTASVHEEEAAAPAVVKEAYCPRCHTLGHERWVGRNVNVGAEVYCPVHKGVRIEA
jgi:hypothetical protein